MGSRMAKYSWRRVLSGIRDWLYKFQPLAQLVIRLAVFLGRFRAVPAYSIDS